MPVGDKTQQIAVIIPKDMVKILDRYQEEEILKSRSSAASKILIKFLKEWDKDNPEE